MEPGSPSSPLLSGQCARSAFLTPQRLPSRHLGELRGGGSPAGFWGPDQQGGCRGLPDVSNSHSASVSEPEAGGEPGPALHSRLVGPSPRWALSASSGAGGRPPGARLTLRAFAHSVPSPAPSP